MEWKVKQWSYYTCNKHAESWQVQWWAVFHVSVCSAGTWSSTLLTQSTRWCCGVRTPVRLRPGSNPCSLLPITSWTRWCLSSVKQPGTASGRAMGYATSAGWQRRLVLAVCAEMLAMWMLGLHSRPFYIVFHYFDILCKAASNQGQPIVLIYSCDLELFWNVTVWHTGICLGLIAKRVLALMSERMCVLHCDWWWSMERREMDRVTHRKVMYLFNNWDASVF